MTVLDGLIVKDMQDMKQEDTMHTTRLDRHEAAQAAHDERIGRLEATILEGCEPTFGSIIKN